MKIVFIQKLIDKIRGKNKPLYKIKKLSKNNLIHIAKGNENHLILDIEGVNNEISICSELNGYASIFIKIFGDNNKVFIKNGFYLSKNMNIIIGQDHKNFGKVTNSEFIIDEKTSVESMDYVTYNSNTLCHIGKNCMISSDVNIYNTDVHPIFNKDSKELINKIKGIEIGEHSWIGCGASILKNSVIPSFSIVGWNAVYTGVKDKSYCVFAGNPAKIVKENVTWDSNGATCGYIDNN